MKHEHSTCYICGTKNRYSSPVDGFIICQPCHFKLVMIGEATKEGIQEKKIN